MCFLFVSIRVSFPANLMKIYTPPPCLLPPTFHSSLLQLFSLYSLWFVLYNMIHGEYTFCPFYSEIKHEDLMKRDCQGNMRNTWRLLVRWGRGLNHLAWKCSYVCVWDCCDCVGELVLSYRVQKNRHIENYKEKDWLRARLHPDTQKR